MNPAIVEGFARSIHAKAELLRQTDLTKQERQRVMEAVSVDIRKYTDLIDHEASDAALAVAAEMGVSLVGVGWHDQHKFDAGRERFITEHVIPVKTIRASCLAATTVEGVATALAGARVAWILREENAQLNALGFSSKRPDPREAYLQAGISLRGLTDDEDARLASHTSPTHAASNTMAITADTPLPVSAEEFDRVVAACRELAPAVGGYAEDNFGPYNDYVTNVLLTVLDLQMHNVAVDKSINFYRQHRWDEIRELRHLQAVLDRFEPDQDGNRETAQYLWGNNHWKRIEWLRGSVALLDEEGLTSQDRLREWAFACEYDRDFRGRAKNLGIAACQWLRMRLGVDTVKPDVHTHAFVTSAIGRRLDDWGVVTVIEAAAHHLKMKARRLDATIWEHQRGATGAV